MTAWIRPWNVVSWSSTCWNSCGRLARKAPARFSVMATPSASALMLLRCSSSEDRAEVTLASSAVRMRSSNQDWMPRLKNAAANTATTMDGVTATTPNISTSRTCRRDPAEPRRRSTQTRVSRPATHRAQQQQHAGAGQDGDEHRVGPQRDGRAAGQQHERADRQHQRHRGQHQGDHLAEHDVHELAQRERPRTGGSTATLVSTGQARQALSRGRRGLWGVAGTLSQCRGPRGCPGRGSSCAGCCG